MATRSFSPRTTILLLPDRARQTMARASLLFLRSRALKSLPPARHSIIFLADEGEEAGLIGARAFVDFHPWAKEVRAAINLDARGSSGPSLLFETGAASEWAIRLFDSSARRPV